MKSCGSRIQRNGKADCSVSVGLHAIRFLGIMCPMNERAFAAYLIEASRHAERRAMSAEKVTSFEELRSMHIQHERQMSGTLAMLACWIMRHDPKWAPPSMNRTWATRINEVWIALTH